MLGQEPLEFAHSPLQFRHALLHRLVHQGSPRLFERLFPPYPTKGGPMNQRATTLLLALALSTGACSGSAKKTAAPGPSTTVTVAPTTTTSPAALLIPEMLNPAVTQATIATTICTTGYTATIRPPSSVTDAIKVSQIASYAYTDTALASYEEDHVIPLELGGAAAAAANLVPEPRAASGTDDTLENTLHTRVCSAAMTLADAQGLIIAAKVTHGYRQAASLAGQPATSTTSAPSTTRVTTGIISTTPTTVAPVATTAVPVTSPATTTPPAVFYANCAAVRAAGKAPLHRGDPGYSSALDRDGDGIACE